MAMMRNPTVKMLAKATFCLMVISMPMRRRIGSAITMRSVKTSTTAYTISPLIALSKLHWSNLFSLEHTTLEKEESLTSEVPAARNREANQNI